MADITIICLVYKSVEYAKFFYENINKYTPELKTGEANLLFVANDATQEVLDFLSDNNYPFIINNNDIIPEDILFKKGFSYPEYINRVYRGYNVGIKYANTDIVILMNSDNFVSIDWLKNLKKRLTEDCVVSPVLIQPHDTFPNPINKSTCPIVNFGMTLESFTKKENDFVQWAEKYKKDTISIGNPLMPVMLYKWQIELVGYYPEGNIRNKIYSSIKYTGDEYFFRKLLLLGIKHINSNDSIVYHIQEGEKKNK